VTNLGAAVAVVCLNGGRAQPVPGTWSASLEWLVARLAPRLPQLSFVELRYRIKSWQQLDGCVADARAAIDAAGASRIVLLGFSMGGAVAVRVAGDPRAEGIVGLAPWLPDRLDLASVRGKRFDILHGSLDRAFPGVPGVGPELSRRGFDRALAAGAVGGYTLIRGAVHGTALRAPSGRLVPLPRASTWARLTELRLAGYRPS
jgi:dienelactone hydrolase